MKTEKNIKINLLIILFSILPISIIVGPSFSLINTVLLGLFFIYIYFSKNDIVVNDFKPVFLLLVLYLYLIINSLISVDITSGIYRNCSDVCLPCFLLFLFSCLTYIVYILFRKPTTERGFLLTRVCPRWSQRATESWVQSR